MQYPCESFPEQDTFANKYGRKRLSPPHYKPPVSSIVSLSALAAFSKIFGGQNTNISRWALGTRVQAFLLIRSLGVGMFGLFSP
jgi:hypothetical protein